MTVDQTSVAIIEVHGLHKTYQMGDNMVDALCDINFTIRQNGLMALMGPSGSGKSTLLNILGALDKPSRGSVDVMQTDVSALDRNQQAEFRNRTIGFIFQNFNLIPVLTTLENVILPAQLSSDGFESDKIERAKELLVKVGLEKQIHQSVNRLSGGQMQRVAIARALINNPPVVLADEPTANLDHKTADDVLNLLQELSEIVGTTVIIATHDHDVLKFCRRVITLHDGKVYRDELSP